MINKSLPAILVVLMLSTIGQSGCSAWDRAVVPNVKRDVKRVEDSRFPVVFVISFKVRYLEDRWWKDPQRTVSAYLNNYNLIPEECMGDVEIVGSGGFENQSIGWARFRCKPI